MIIKTSPSPEHLAQKLVQGEIVNVKYSFSITDMDDQTPKVSQTGYKGIKAVFGSTSYHQKPPPVPVNDPKQNPLNNNNTLVSQGLSTALDSRLELGLETRAEMRLRMMLFSQSDTLQGAFTSQLPVPTLNGQGQGNSRSSPPYDDITESVSGTPQVIPQARYRLYLCIH